MTSAHKYEGCPFAMILLKLDSEVGCEIDAGAFGVDFIPNGTN